MNQCKFVEEKKSMANAESAQKILARNVVNSTTHFVMRLATIITFTTTSTLC